MWGICVCWCCGAGLPSLVASVLVWWCRSSWLCGVCPEGDCAGWVGEGPCLSNPLGDQLILARCFCHAMQQHATAGDTAVTSVPMSFDTALGIVQRRQAARQNMWVASIGTMAPRNYICMPLFPLVIVRTSCSMPTSVLFSLASPTSPASLLPHLALPAESPAPCLPPARPLPPPSDACPHPIRVQVRGLW